MRLLRGFVLGVICISLNFSISAFNGLEKSIEISSSEKEAVMPPEIITFTIGDITGDIGDIVCIPITVSDFVGVVSIQFAFNFDPSVLQYTGFLDPNNLIGLSGGNLNPNNTNGFINFVWIDPNVGTTGGVTLADGEEILEIAENQDFDFADVKKLGSYTEDHTYIDKHIQKVLDLDLVDVEAIKKANFKIAIDCVNSTGGIAVPRLLKALGVETVKEFYCEPNGHFPHNPEPLPEHLTELCSEIERGGYDLGITVEGLLAHPRADQPAHVKMASHQLRLHALSCFSVSI